MKVGDLVMLKEVKAYQRTLYGLVGLVVEFVPSSQRTREAAGEDICRIFWGRGLFNNGFDKCWKRRCDFEVISESR